MTSMRPPQDTAPQVSLAPPVGRPDLVDAGLHRALAAVARGGRAGTDDLHEAVCRYARQARARDLGARDAATWLCSYVRAPLATLPIVARREIEHQIAWWVAQEYHRDD
jgi:hypothetical protein